MVPLTGLEPVQYRYRGILSPLCLPIPPQRQVGLFYHDFIGSSSQSKAKPKYVGAIFLSNASHMAKGALPGQ